MTSLDQLSLLRAADITSLRMSEREAAWLRAVGLGEGETVTVLRKAPMGGPLHVRLSNGAEMAVDLTLAGHVEVTPGRVQGSE